MINITPLHCLALTLVSYNALSSNNFTDRNDPMILASGVLDSYQPLAGDDKPQLSSALDEMHSSDSLETKITIPALSRGSQITWTGYGSFDVQRVDAYRNVQVQNPDQRNRADARKFVLQASKWLSPSVLASAELEYEHGGTGAAIEYEAEEFGEYELEIESGGEVIVEQLNLSFLAEDSIRIWRFGQFVVPVGSANIWHAPEDSFTVNPSRMEQALIPVTWTAIGAELSGIKGRYTYQFQLINSLDSSLFSGYGYVSDGASQRQEFRLADNIAGVARLERTVGNNASTGVSVFIGDTAKSRPNQNLSESAVLSIAEAHARYRDDRYILRAQYLYSSLSNADLVSAANNNTFGASVLGVSRTSIGSSAQGWSVEAAYDIAPLVLDRTQNKRLDVFARFEGYDSMASTEGSVQDNARYERKVQTLGLNYTHPSGVIFKTHFSHEENQGTTANTFDTLAMGIGFNF